MASVGIDVIDYPIKGIVKVHMTFRYKNKEESVTLKNVSHSPRHKRNLISGHLTDKNGTVFEGKNGQIRVLGMDGRVIFHAKNYQGLYYVYPQYPKYTKASNVLNTIDNSPNKRQTSIKSSNECCVRGLSIFEDIEKANCNSSGMAKSKTVSHTPVARAKSGKPLELLKIDLCLMPVKSKEGHRYFLSILDDYSGKATVFLLKRRRILVCFKKWQKRVERFTGYKVFNVMLGQGLEFCRNQFEDYFEYQGISTVRTNTYFSVQNGVNESFNFTAVETVKTLLEDSSLNDSFWDEAILYSTYTWNTVCHHDHAKSPFELFWGKAPSVKHLQCFGTTAYVEIPRHLSKTLNPRAKEGVMVGYAMSMKGYRIWLPDERRVIETSNVKFKEPINLVLDSVIPNLHSTNKVIKAEIDSNISHVDQVDRKVVSSYGDQHEPTGIYFSKFWGTEVIQKKPPSVV